MFDEVKGKLGFGLMRLPKDAEGKSDIKETSEMVDMFLDAGFTYFDTAYVYGDSEDTIRQALCERHPRESFQLASKLAAWVTPADAEKAKGQLETSLKRTGAGYFDYYLLHNLGSPRTAAFDNNGIWDWIQEKKKEDLVKNVGFSAHATPEELDEILTMHPEMDFVQLQINYADWEVPAIKSGECYEIARKHGKKVIVMEPVKGGNLANPPEPVAKIFKEADPSASPSSWAVRFAASLDGVALVLSGMSNIDQMKDNLSYMKDFKPLSDKEQKVIEEARKALAAIPLIPCTACEYCAKVCPKNIGISSSFHVMNFLTIYGNKKVAKGQEVYYTRDHGKGRAIDCIKCGKCEEVCPQHIAIRDELDNVVKELISE